MRRFLLCALLSVALCSCEGERTHIEGRIIGAESSKIYIERVEMPTTKVIDSTLLNDKGEFKISFVNQAQSPEFYNIVSDGERIPLLLASADRVSINAMGNISSSYRLEGSHESELLRLFFQQYLMGIVELEKIASQYASPRLSDEQRLEIAHRYGTEYQRIKQAQLRFIIENKSSIAAIYALFQRLVGDEYLFNESSDLIYFRTVADALNISHPTSPYLESLRHSIKNMESSITLKANIERVGFPDLAITDMHGQQKRLSQLIGRVILLNFWSPEAGNSNIQNAELKDIYMKYRNQGFEIYQVGVTTSKPLWISTVQDQRLPWISVSDIRGAVSQSLGLYNVTTLPTSFLIDREGDVVERDVTIDDTLESKIERLLN